jgi:hypothetical protein
LHCLRHALITKEWCLANGIIPKGHPLVWDVTNEAVNHIKQSGKRNCIYPLHLSEREDNQRVFILKDAGGADDSPGKTA